MCGQFHDRGITHNSIARPFPRPFVKSGLGYTHLPELGGLRHAQRDSPNMGWRNPSFRGYADYMQTLAFEVGLDTLMTAGEGEPIVVMCAEAVPWRCHRSLIADALSIRGISVKKSHSRIAGFEHRVDFDLPPNPCCFPAEVETALFRIMQECLTNIVKHAGSLTASIRITVDTSRVIMKIRDQGKGMSMTIWSTKGQMTSNLGVGIMGMRERVRQLHGRLDIDSGDSGTAVTTTPLWPEMNQGRLKYLSRG
jgi:hypothetical protein